MLFNIDEYKNPLDFMVCENQQDSDAFMDYLDDAGVVMNLGIGEKYDELRYKHNYSISPLCFLFRAGIIMGFDILHSAIHESVFKECAHIFSDYEWGAEIEDVLENQEFNNFINAFIVT